MNKAFDRIAVFEFQNKAVPRADDGDMIVDGTMSTSTLDLVSESMLMSGCKNWAQYKKNPVLMWQHGEQIGHAIELNREGDRMTVKDKLAATRLVLDTVWPLAVNESLRAMSIGFRGLAGKEIEGGWQWTEWQLFEHSLVSVPANPEARATIAKSLGMEIPALPLSGKAVVPYQDLPIMEDPEHPWDAGAARKRIAEWAGEDMAKYKKAFLWFDSDAPENVTSYKLPFADVVDGGLKAVFRGVAACVAVMHGGRGGADIPEADQSAIMGQLTKYYKKWDKPMPEKSADGLVWYDGEWESFLKYQFEQELAREKSTRACGAIQGVSDIAVHWQGAGVSVTEAMGAEQLAELYEAHKRLGDMLRGVAGDQPVLPRGLLGREPRPTDPVLQVLRG